MLSSVKPPADSPAQLVGRRIREARLRAKLTQAALAERLGVASSYVTKLERGGRNPSIPYLRKLGAILDVEASFFLTSRKCDKP